MKDKRKPFRSYIPNTITLSNLAVGCLSAVAAWNDLFLASALLILICAALDFLDGFAAKMLNAYSDIGKQLDSLADLVSFGVAPAALASRLIIAAALSRGWDSTAWPVVLLAAVPLAIPVFSAIRLARFNIQEQRETHFTGMPVPADAVFFAALALIKVDLRFVNVDQWVLSPIFITILVLANSYLMVSPMSMFSFKLKTYRPGANRWRYLFAGVSLVLILIFRGYGLLTAFFLYVSASIVMNFRLRSRKGSEPRWRNVKISRKVR